MAAERLIAERGIEVPLKDIAVAADQRNNSAVQYYFGSRDGLVRAVLDYRTLPAEQRRLERITQLQHEGSTDDPRALAATLVEPLFDARHIDGATHHARFLEQVRTHPGLVPAALRVEGSATVRLVMTLLERALHPLPGGVRAWRLRAVGSVMFALLADDERAAETARTDRQEELARERIVDAMTSVLTGPVGES